jgi:hypothetical protein
MRTWQIVAVLILAAAVLGGCMEHGKETGVGAAAGGVIGGVATDSVEGAAAGAAVGGAGGYLYGEATEDDDD